MSCTSINNNRINLKKCLETTKFKESQILNFHKNFFSKYSRDGIHLTFSEFREGLGIIGAKSNDFIPRRLFQIISKGHNDKISFESYIKFLNLVNNGTITDKLAHSFNFFDMENKGFIDRNTFKKVIMSISDFLSQVSSHPLKAKESDIMKIYDLILEKTDSKILDLNSFLTVSLNYPKLLDFFEMFNNKIFPEYKVTEENLNAFDNIQNMVETLLYKVKMPKKSDKLTIINKALVFRLKNASKKNFDFHNVLVKKQNKFKVAGQQVKIEENSESSLEWEESMDEKEILTQSDLTQNENFDFEILDPINFNDELKEVDKNSKHEYLIISNKSQFLLYLEKINSEINRLKNIIKSSSKSNKVQRRKQIQIVNSNKHEVAKDSFFKHKKSTNNAKGLIHFGSDNIESVVNMMIGIKMSTNSQGSSHSPYDLKNNEEAFKELNIYNYSQKYEGKETICQFEDHSPKAFYNIRSMYKIKKDDYLNSLGPENFLGNLILVKNKSLRELGSTGKSGSFFFFSYDSRFVLKTIPEHEFQLFKNILKEYYFYLEANPDTLIQRIYGLHTMTINEQKLYFFVMNNVFYTTKEIHRKYDLKGSMYGRTSLAEGQTYETYDFDIPLKDIDYLNRKEKINIHYDKAEKLVNQLKKDSQFLSDHNINDYSLLIGIHDIEHNDKENNPAYIDKMIDNYEKESVDMNLMNNQNQSIRNERKPFFEDYKGGILSEDGKTIYFIGVIDIFTYYGPKKSMEHFFKSIIYKEISCMPPYIYSERFYTFMKGVLQNNSN